MLFFFFCPRCEQFTRITNYSYYFLKTENIIHHDKFYILYMKTSSKLVNPSKITRNKFNCVAEATVERALHFFACVAQYFTTTL